MDHATDLTFASDLVDLLFEDALVGRCLVAPDGAVLRANRAWLRYTGLPVGQVIGADALGSFPGARDLSAAMDACARGARHVEIPRHLRRLHGRKTGWEGSIDPVPMVGGTGLLISARPLERDPEASPPVHDDPTCGSLLDVVNDAVFVHDASTGAVLDVNHAAEEMYEAPRDVLCDGGLEALSLGEPPYTIREALAYVQAAAAGRPQRFEWRARTWSGRPFWVEVHLKAVWQGGRGRLFAVVRDITKRKRAETALRESEERLRVLANAMPQIVCVLAPDGTAEHVNQRWTELSGLDLDATNAVGWAGILHPEDLAAARACRVRALKTLAPQEVELRYRSADGSFRWFLSRLAPVVEGRRVVRLVGAAMDIEVRKRAEGALEEQLALKDQLAKVAASVPGVICSFRLRPDGSMSMPFSVPGIEELYGYSRDELARDMAPAIANVHEEDRAAALDQVAVSARDLTVWRGQFRYWHPVKRLRWIEGTAIPAREADGSVLWHGYVADVTDRKRGEEALRAREQQLRQLADAMPQLVWTARADGTPDYGNRQWCDYTGMSIEDASDGRWLRVLHPEDVERCVERWRHSVATGEPYEFEYRLRCARDGSYRWFLARAVAVRGDSGAVVQWFGTCTDIHAHKSIEEELLAAKQAAAAAAASLREEHRRKDEFLGMLSHELRNPLAPVRNALYILEHAEPAGPEAHRAMEIANRQLRHITRIVDDLLDVTRIARGKIELRRTALDFAALARRTGEDHRTLMNDRGITLALDVPDEPLIVNGDETRLAQVIGNLLSNAAKFTPAGGEVALSVRRTATDVVAHVRDTGAGIASDVLTWIFEPFMQAAQTLARSEGGLGLGLAMVKGLVSLHGGTVDATSAGVGRGTDFAVTLPLASGRAVEPPREAWSAHAGSARTVLVVDDNRDAADTLAQLVVMLGHRVEVAYDGPSALTSASRADPDLVLCDIGLPGLDGYEVARRLRCAGLRARLVAVSGYGQPEDVEQAMQAGFDAHVTKPPDPARIEALIGG